MAERLMPSGTADKTVKWTEGVYTPGLMAAVTVNWRSIDKEETDAAECDKTRCSANKNTLIQSADKCYLCCLLNSNRRLFPTMMVRLYHPSGRSLQVIFKSKENR